MDDPAGAPRTSPTLRESSVFDGLDRRAVTEADLTAHSVAVVAPSVSALGLAFALPSMVGPGAWLSVLLGFGLAYALARVFGEFGSRMTAAGSLYTYTAKGLGAGPALVVGVSLLLGYATLVSFGLTGTARRVEDGWGSLAGSPAPFWLEAGTVLGTLVLLVAVMARGVRYSTRFALVAEAFSLSVLVLVLGYLLLRHGVPGPEALSLVDASPGRILLGAAAIMTITVGFESAAALGVEASRPFLTVPRSMRSTVLLTGGLFFCSVLVNSGPAGSAGATRGRWIAPGAELSPLDGVASLVLAASYVALALSAWIALSRLVFSLSREGLLWRRLGRLHRVGRHPRTAVWATLPVVAAPYVVTVATGHRVGWATSTLLDAATVILFVAYALAALALVPFLRRLDEAGPGVVALACGAAAGVVVMAGAGVVHDSSRGHPVTALLLAAVVTAGLAWRALLGRRGSASVRRVGRHDETLAHEVLPGTGEWRPAVRGPAGGRS